SISSEIEPDYFCLLLPVGRACRRPLPPRQAGRKLRPKMLKEDNAMLTRRAMLGQVAAGGAWALGSGVAAAAIGGTATNFPIPRAALQGMAGAGARGIRLNLNTAGVFDPNTAKQQLDTVAEQLRGLNWHVQMFVALSVISALTDYFKQYPYPVVFDHFGQPKAPQGVGQPGFANLLELVKSGHAYVKISGAYRVSTEAPAYADATPLAQALVAANSDRIVWGTDWPHPNGGSARSINEIATPFPIDDGLLLNELPKWVSDAATRKKILVD